MALPQLRAALRDRPNDARAHLELGRCQMRLGDYEGAIASSRDALRLRKQWPEASTQLAWLLATSPDARLRNGTEAIRLADAGVKMTRQRTPIFLETLAAAHAETADFDKALKLQREAIEAAKILGDEKLRADLEKRMDGYLKKKPHREPAKEAERPAPRKK